MSNYFEHLAMRALGHVRPSDAQPQVRSRFEPESPRRSLPDDVAGSADPVGLESAAAPWPADRPSVTSSAPRGRAASTALPVLADVQQAATSAPASFDNDLAAARPGSEVLPPPGPREPARVEVASVELAAAHTALANPQPAVSRGPSPSNFSEGLSAQVPPVASESEAVGSLVRPPVSAGSAAGEAASDAAPLAKRDEDALVHAEKSSDLALDGPGAKEDIGASSRPATPSPAAFLGPSERKTKADVADLTGVAVGPPVAPEARPAADRPPTTAEDRPGPLSAAGSTEESAARPPSPSALADRPSGPAVPQVPASPASRAQDEPPRPLAATVARSAVPVAMAAPPSVPVPQVHIRIGRIEVRAPVAKPVATQAPAIAARTPSVSLSDYLSQTRGRG